MKFTEAITLTFDFLLSDASLAITTILLTILSLIFSIYIFHIQAKMPIIKEKLDIVFFPLMTVIKSFNPDSKADDLYRYLSDNMKDEKYFTLISSPKITIAYNNLEKYICDNQNISSSESNKLYDNLINQIQTDYHKFKRKAKYESSGLNWSMYLVIIASVISFIIAIVNKYCSLTEHLFVLLCIALFVVYLLIFISLIILIPYLYKYLQLLYKNATPFILVIFKWIKDKARIHNKH